MRNTSRTIIVRGEPATVLRLIEGELAMSKLSGGQAIETNRTSHARVLRCLAGVHRWEPKALRRVVHGDQPSRFFVMDAPVFAQFMRDPFPDGGSPARRDRGGHRPDRRIIDNREKLLALGRLSAGLTHQAEQSAAAIARPPTSARPDRPPCVGNW